MAILEHKDLPMCYLLHPSPFLIALQKLTRPDLGVGDNCAILDFSHRHLTGHSWTYLRNFWFCRIFSCKITPQHCKNRFFKSKGSPIFKSSFYQSHMMAFGLTIPKWYNTWVLQIFFVNIFFFDWKKIF